MRRPIGVSSFQLIALCAIVFSFGVGIGIFISNKKGDGKQCTDIALGEVRQRAGAHTYTNPLLECKELPQAITTIGTRVNLQEEVAGVIRAHKEDSTLLEASVYFRDLNNGPWFGVNEEKKFQPASLLKLPLAMWYYAEADKDPGILAEEVHFKGPRGVSDQHFPPNRVIQEGKTYTVEELIEIMLQESENDASVILSQFAGSENTSETFKDFGMNPASAQSLYLVDVHTYASFFRTLYNATYIGRALSEHILDIMSHSSFTKGLVAGIPKEVPVSHKFGEKIIDASVPIYQLHDCGIVYLPETPYVLCIMTQGRDFDELASIIAELSKLVYENIRT